MKLFIFFVLAVTFQASAAVKAQTFTFSKNNATLPTIFLEIQKQSGYNFLYNDAVLKRSRKVNISVNRMPVSEVLDLVFKELPLTYSIINKTIIVKEAKNKKGIPDPITVTGSVTDEQGNPLSQVSISVKGKNTGTTTGDDGNYSINVDENATLEISFVGYISQTIEVKGRTDISIILQKTESELDKVVVIGYGTKKKIHLTGAVATIGSEELTEAPVANLSNVIAGRLPGVIATSTNGRPGSGSTLNIRGFSTLGNNSPLVVVDGVPRDGFNAFDPNEVESITVLKDAAATAVYGARANNGVFLVTTKRGKMGKPTVSYTGTLGIQQPTQYPNILNAEQYATAYNEGLLNAGFDRNNPAHATRFFSDEQIGKFRSGEEGGDWYAATFKKNPTIKNHNLTINGGSEAIKYFVSLSTIDQDGMYDNINYKGYKFRSNVDAKISNSLTIGIGIEGRQENSNASGYDANSIFSSVARLSPIFKAYHPSGRPVNTGGENAAEEARNSGYNNLLINTFQGTLSAEQKLSIVTPGLSARASVSFGKQYGFRKAFILPYIMYNEDADGNVTGSKSVGAEPHLTEEFTQNYSKFYNISLNYQRNFANKHDVSALLLYEQNEGLGDQFLAFRQDFPITSKDEFFVSGPENQYIEGRSLINDARRALVGRLGYVFDDKYLLEGSFRYDGSYIFPEGKRFGFFPAVSAGWRVSEENFFKNSSALSFITNLKIRASKGLVGNDKVSAFQYQDAYSLSTSIGPFYNNVPQPVVYYGVFPNPNITWEKSDNTNIGFEANFWRNLLGIEFDYFIKDTRDILWSRVRSVPQTFGRSLPNENYARVKNKGFELLINHQNKIGEVGYKLSANGSYAKNKVLEIDDPANALDFQKQINRPLGIRVGYEALGFFQSQEEISGWMGGKQFGLVPKLGQIKYADLNGDNVIDSKDQKVLSDNTGTPRIIVGFSGSVSWKGFDLGFLLQGAAARNFLLTQNGRILFEGGSRNGFEYLLDAWSPTNTDARFPSIINGATSNNSRNSDIWLINGNYLRLKSINLSYTFSDISVSKVHLKKVRLFVSGFNLLTWSKVKDFDPEAESSGGNYYPQQRVLSAGLNVNF